MTSVYHPRKYPSSSSLSTFSLYWYNNGGIVVNLALRSVLLFVHARDRTDPKQSVMFLKYVTPRYVTGTSRFTCEFHPPTAIPVHNRTRSSEIRYESAVTLHNGRFLDLFIQSTGKQLCQLATMFVLEHSS